MSLQTKEQQIGYVLKSLYELNINVQEFDKAKAYLKENVDAKDVLDNWTGESYLKMVLDELALEDKYTEARSNLYYSYDMKTVEEAGTYYDYYMAGRPVKNRRQLWEERN
jgi:hypothetical protein